MRAQKLGARASIEQLDSAIDRLRPVLGLDRARIRLVRENEFARVIARPHRRSHRFDQGAGGGGVFELLLVTTGEFGEFVLDPADLPQPQDRAAAGHLTLGFEDATGERGHRHGEGDAARAQGIDRTLHLAGGFRLEPGAEGEDALGVSAAVTSVGSPMISGSSLPAAQATRICCSESRSA